MLSKISKEALLGPLSRNNPVLVQILGICSCLAVTAKLEPAIVMGISVTAITAFSNLIISLIRNTIPNNIRIIVQLVVVAALVIIVDQILKAYNYEMSKALSFIPRRHRQWHRLCHYTYRRGIFPRIARVGHLVWISSNPAGILRHGVFQQRAYDFASHGTYYRRLHHLVAPLAQQGFARRTINTHTCKENNKVWKILTCL